MRSNNVTTHPLSYSPCAMTAGPALRDRARQPVTSTDDPRQLLEHAGVRFDASARADPARRLHPGRSRGPGPRPSEVVRIIGSNKRRTPTGPVMRDELGPCPPPAEDRGVAQLLTDADLTPTERRLCEFAAEGGRLDLSTGRLGDDDPAQAGRAGGDHYAGTVDRYSGDHSG